MTEMNDTTAPVKPFVISREFDAPRELVWKAWTEPERLAKWSGPKGAIIKYCKMELRPGGTNHTCMSYAGQDIWSKLYYREVEPPSRLVYATTFSDEQGGVTRHPLAKTWPAELLTTITLEERDGKTTVTIEWIPINANAEEVAAFDAGRGSMTQGWGGSLDALAEYLSAA